MKVIRPGSKLHTERVSDMPEQLSVRTVQLPGAVANPQKVPGGVIRLTGPRVDPGQGMLVLQDQRLMAGVEVHGPEYVVVNAAGHHEGESAIDLVRQVLILHASRGVLDEVGVPAVHTSQVGEPAGDERPRQVQGGRGRVVDLQEPLRIRLSSLGCELEAVHGITAICRQRDAITRFGGRAARLGKLARHPANFDDRHLCGVRQHNRHGQQGTKLALDVCGGHLGERLGAIATLQHESLTGGNAGHLGA